MNEQLKLTGKVVDVSAYQQGKSANGKDWEKRTFVIEHGDGQYKDHAGFTLFGEKTKLCPAVGETVEVHFNVKARQWGEKWYTELQAWKINSLSQHAAAAAEPVDDGVPIDDDMPF